MLGKTKIFLGFIIMLMVTDISAQKLLRKAEIQAESGEYQKSIESYKAHLEDHIYDYEAIAKLADLYIKTGDLSEANIWYQSIPESLNVNQYIFKNHGDLLKKLFRYDEAIAKYKLFGKIEPIKAARCIASTEFAKNEMSSAPSNEIVLMPSNSTTSDFGLTFYNNMPVFSSFREDILMTESEREFNVNNYAHKTFLYNAPKNRLGYIKGQSGNINHLGPLSFTESGNKCAIIEAKIQDNYNLVRSFMNSSLHIAEINDNGEITSSKPFPYNEVGSSINSAHLTFDGGAIYFSSDRKGGMGGFDLYVSYFNNGIWSIPQNLGNIINTEGDEITPYLHQNVLYFASDDHVGLGGFDILKSEVKQGIWSKPINMGNGINSPADDYFPFYNINGELYITSNRLGGRGNNDIYKTFILQNTQVVSDEYSSIPPAVSLEDMAIETQKHTTKDVNNVNQVSLKENTVAFKLPEFDAKKVGSNTENTVEMTLDGAHRIALDELIPNTEVFFIQLASMSSSKPNFSKFKPLLRYGNIYKMLNNNTIKVRLGYFSDRKEAEDILIKVKANGYKDAFIAFEVLNTAQMELILSGTDDKSFSDKGNFNTKNPEVEKEYKSGNKYKVRLASYEDPIWFDVNKVKDLGRVEQWTKGGWTIFILAGYNNLDEAKKATIQANNRGFKTAEVVIDNGGILERLKQN